MKYMKWMRIVVVSALFAGCGHASIWSQDGQGGVLTLHGSEGPAMDDAQKVMAGHCGAGRFEIVRRDSVVVGQQAYSNQQTRYADKKDRNRGSTYRQGGAQTTSVSGVQDVTETRITYACMR